MKQALFGVLGLLLAAGTSCAASNGGSYGVGNSMITDSASKKMVDPKNCDCPPGKDGKVKKACACSTPTPSPTPSPKASCKPEDKTCKK